MRSSSRLLFAALLVLSWAPDANAQTTTGGFSGNVVDDSGLVLPGATVTILQEETGAIRNSVTNEVGSFNFAAVQPGPYTVRIELPGFSTYELTGAQLATNQQYNVGTVELSIAALAGDRPGHRAADRRDDQLGPLRADHRGDDRRHHGSRPRRHVDAADPAGRRLPARPGRDRRDRHRLVAAERRRHAPGLEHGHHRRHPRQRHRSAGGLEPFDEPGRGRRGERPAHQLHRGHGTQRRRADQPGHQGGDERLLRHRLHLRP